MNIDQKLKSALDVIAPAFSGEYTGEADTYVVYTYASMGAYFRDNRPAYEVYAADVCLFCPGGNNSLDMRREIKDALTLIGFTWPSYTDMSDDSGQRHVFSCEIAAPVEDE